MERKAIAVSLGVVVIAAIAWFTFCPTGLRVGSLRVVPPAPGECVGRVEATVVNGTSDAIWVGRLTVLQDGHRPDGLGNRYPLGRRNSFGREDPLFVNFGASATRVPFDRGQSILEPGASCVVGVGFVRVRGGAAARISIQGQILAHRIDEETAALRTPPVDVDPAVWPLPVTMGPEALDRAMGEGHEISIVLEEAGMPGGPWVYLEIGPGGRARAGGHGGRSRADELLARVPASGRLTPEQQASLRAAVRSAPFSAFRVDPQWVDDGHQVRLLVAAGSAAFAGDAQEEEFGAAGLGPLLEHLRIHLCDLPDAGGGR